MIPMQSTPLVGVGVVVLKGGQVLLVRRSKPPRLGQWSLPGGRQELGETLDQAARREVLEETGITCRIASLVDVIDLIDRDSSGTVERHFTLIDYVAEWVEGDPVAGDDALEAAWVPLHGIEKLGLWEETVRVIRMAEAMIE